MTLIRTRLILDLEVRKQFHRSAQRAWVLVGIIFSAMYSMYRELLIIIFCAFVKIFVPCVLKIYEVLPLK
jgi:hypothetical protein